MSSMQQLDEVKSMEHFPFALDMLLPERMTGVGKTNKHHASLVHMCYGLDPMRIMCAGDGQQRSGGMLEYYSGYLNGACHITAVENMSSDHDDRLLKLEQQATRLKGANKALQEIVTDLEARSRRQNIKIVGLPENVENGWLIDFVANLFPTVFGREHFLSPIKVYRARRLGIRQANNVNGPRVLIARIHDDCIKELIMQLAKQQAPLMYQGQHIHIFPDFPSEIMKQRQLFEATRKRLKDAGICTGFIYLAHLVVTHGNITSRFDNLEEAARLADGVVSSVEASRE